MPVVIELKNMDWGLLRRQKLILLMMQNRERSLLDREGKSHDNDEYNTIEGIINLIDAIQDDVVESKQLTEREVFKAKMPRRVK